MVVDRQFSGSPVADRYRCDIDGLRAVAVSAVVGYHAFPAWFPGGFIGVDIFFVISGYLITAHILQSLATGTFSTLDFYARRIRRIFPALIIVCLFCLIFGWFSLLPDEYRQLGKHVAGGAGFASNIILWLETGYFDPTSATKPLLHLWSLGIEEQFYFIWPLVAFALWKLRANMLAGIAILAGVSMALNTGMVKSDSVAAFYLPYSRFWELLIGAGLAQFERERITYPSVLIANSISGLSLGLLALGFLTITDAEPFPGWLALMPTLGAAGLIAAGSNAAINKWLLGNKAFVFVGLISYPLYLWHWPLLSFAQIIEGGIPARTVRIALVLLAFLLAFATYTLVEKPLRRGAFARAKVAGLFSFMVVLGAVGTWVFVNAGLLNRAFIQKTNTINAQFVGPLWAYTQNDTCLAKYPFADAKDYGWWFCMLGKDAPPTVLLLGSSFANHLYPGLALSPHFRNQNILSIGACDPAEVEESYINGETTTNPCSGAGWANQQKFINDIVERETSIKYIIVDGINPSASEEYKSQLAKRIGTLQKISDAEIIVFAPHLRLEVDVKSCFSRPLRKATSNCNFTAAHLSKWSETFLPLKTQIETEFPNVKIFDQNQVFCEKGSCSLVVEGMPMVRDEYHHYSEFGSLRLGTLFAEWAETELPDIVAPNP